MYVDYYGWDETRGSFSFRIPVDETRVDYEVRLKNGNTFRQTSPFQYVTHDWNHDGDVYTRFGAYFSYDGPCGGGEFLTPDDMVSMVVHDEATIPGIPNPLKHPTLDEQIDRAVSQSRTPPSSRNKTPER